MRCLWCSLLFSKLILIKRYGLHNIIDCFFIHNGFDKWLSCPLEGWTSKTNIIATLILNGLIVFTKVIWIFSNHTNFFFHFENAFLVEFNQLPLFICLLSLFIDKFKKIIVFFLLIFDLFLYNLVFFVNVWLNIILNSLNLSDQAFEETSNLKPSRDSFSFIALKQFIP